LIAGANWPSTSLKILVSFWDLTVAGTVGVDGFRFDSAVEFPGMALIRGIFLFGLAPLECEKVPDP
jgi:hypothetical protein